MAVVKVETSAKFDKEFERLADKYRSLLKSIDDLLDALKRGDQPGNRVTGTGHIAYKVRLRNPDARRGKSGGFRVIYYVRVKDHVYLMTIYSKTEQEDISPAEIRRLIDEILP